MRVLIVLTVMIIAANCQAGYREKVSYWYSQNVSADVPKASEICTRTKLDSGDISIKWNASLVSNPPDKAVVDAIDDVVATDWYKDYWAEKESGGNKNTVLEAAMIATIAEITGETEQSVKTKFKKHKKAKLKEK